MTETNMRGILFKNEKKEGDGPNKPDFTGNARVNDTNYYISGWVNTKGENRYLNLSFTPVTETAEQGAASQKAPVVEQDIF